MSLLMRFEWVVNERFSFLLVPYGVRLVPLNNYSCSCLIPGIPMQSSWVALDRALGNLLIIYA